MSKRVCSRPGCPTLVDQGGRCPGCTTAAATARGSATQRGYGREHRHRFREGVLARDPICVSCYRARSSVADHYPRDKRELVAAGLDDHDPQYGRGLCKPCHDRHTAQAQPGGWARSLGD